MSKPIPEVTEQTRPFWEGGLTGELRMQKCRHCSHIRFPVGPVCTKCLSDAFDWVPMSRQGEVLSHLVFHRGYGQGWNDQIPYSVLFVQLKEGPRMFLDLLDAERRYIDRDLVGKTVSIVFDVVAENVAVPRASDNGTTL